jgi:hypothetical protein
MGARSAVFVLFVGCLAALVVGGCGEKIAIPQAKGDFSITAYQEGEVYNMPGVLQLTVSQGRLYVLTGDSLQRRDIEFEERTGIGGLAGAGAFCVDSPGDLIFVWEQDVQRVQWFRADSLFAVGSTDLPEVQSCVGMAENDIGIEQVPGAITYLYLSDPAAGVIHRYAFDTFNGLIPHGILARSGGQAARFVQEPAGLATDSGDFLLVCDADTSRNWVIHFSGFPDTTDVGLGNDPDPLRGKVALFDLPSCPEPPAADYVLGNAAGCDDPDWVGGPGGELGEFHRPLDVAIDGSGRIFVADAENNRIQVFSARGEYQLQFGSAELSPRPVSLGIHNTLSTGGADLPNYGAYVFVALPELGTVRRFISNEQYQEDTGKPPPPVN